MLRVSALDESSNARARGLDLRRAGAWFSEQSGGHFSPEFEDLAQVELGELSRHGVRGGVTAYPHNSQAMVERACARLALDAAALTRLVALEPELTVITPPGFRPHTWRLPGGGLRLAGGATSVHRYTVLPEDASLGAMVHELAHLLLGWPDLERDSGLGIECLMARGALLAEPAPPCAVLRLRAGWLEPRRVTRTTTTDELALGEAVVVGERVIERRAGPDRLLVMLDRPRPVLLRRVELRPADLARPLLAVARFGPGVFSPR